MLLTITAFIAYFESLTETTSPTPLFDVARVFLPNCRSLSKQDDSASLGMRWGWIPHSTLTEPSEYQFVDCREIGSVPLVAHDTPGFVLWKQTCCLSTLAWMLHGDLLRIEHAGGTSWRLLRSSQRHAPDDDITDGLMSRPQPVQNAAARLLWPRNRSCTGFRFGGGWISRWPAAWSTCHCPAWMAPRGLTWHLHYVIVTSFIHQVILTLGLFRVLALLAGWQETFCCLSKSIVFCGWDQPNLINSRKIGRLNRNCALPFLIT